MAITRAKALLIVVGNAKILRRDKNWRRLVGKDLAFVIIVSLHTYALAYFIIIAIVFVITTVIITRAG